ncbi:MAG: YbhB/YbcL family Raf kinase inhibitor-like protein [Candidatus Bathyarchaeota archaeon]|nr:YbhB/YbcL family Raf kinase inhibitor-like protein [Candidatus Bathyarchaeota archaeon]
MQKLKIISSAFKNNERIPSKYTCDGIDVNPPLKFQNIPNGTKSLALIIDDPDAPMGTWVHWIVWNVNPTEEIDEDTVPGVEGINDFNKTSYGGPCPPSGIHRYFFKIYALKTKLDLNSNARKRDLEEAMKGKIIAKGEIVGLYGR